MEGDLSAGCFYAYIVYDSPFDIHRRGVDYGGNSSRSKIIDFLF